MLDWLDRRNKLIEQVQDHRRATAQADEAEKEEIPWCGSLAAALKTSQSVSLADLAAKARVVVDESAESRHKRKTLETQKRETEASLRNESQNLRENEEGVNTWGIRWNAALVEAHLNKASDPTIVLTMFDLISTFWMQAAKIKDLKRCVGSMHSDDQKYSEAVKALVARSIRANLGQLDALASIREIEKLARTAQENDKTATRVEQERSRTQRELGEALASMERSGTALQELLCEAMSPKSAFSAKLLNAVNAKRQSPLQSGRTPKHWPCPLTAPVDTFIGEVQLTNPDLLPVELDQLQSRLKMLDAQGTEKSRELDDIDRTFKIKEAAAETTKASFEKNAAAARVDELSSEFFEYQLSATLLEKALARYRLKHQDPILKCAGEFFSALTRGAFSGLTAAYENSDRIMTATRENDDSLGVEAMSDGTRD